MVSLEPVTGTAWLPFLHVHSTEGDSCSLQVRTPSFGRISHNWELAVLQEGKDKGPQAGGACLLGSGRVSCL